MARLDLKKLYELAVYNIESHQRVIPQEKSPRGNYGISDISFYISCCLVGYHKEAEFLLNRALPWIDQAILDGNEFGGGDGHYSRLYQARAIGEWLLHGGTAGQEWDQARRLKESYWRTNKVTMQEVVRDDLNDYMAFAVLGDGEPRLDTDCYEAGIEMHEYWVRSTDISLKKTLKPREFGYAMCRHHARGDFDEHELLEAGHRMLKANLAEEWFGMGQDIRAATWLMIVNWHAKGGTLVEGARPSPLEALLMAYDDMPGVEKPF